MRIIQKVPEILLMFLTLLYWNVPCDIIHKEENMLPRCENACILNKEVAILLNNVLSCAHLPLTKYLETNFNDFCSRRIRVEAANAASQLTGQGLAECLKHVGQYHKNGRYVVVGPIEAPEINDETTFYDLCVWVCRHLRPNTPQ